MVDSSPPNPLPRRSGQNLMVWPRPLRSFCGSHEEFLPTWNLFCVRSAHRIFSPSDTWTPGSRSPRPLLHFLPIFITGSSCFTCMGHLLLRSADGLLHLDHHCHPRWTPLPSLHAVGHNALQVASLGRGPSDQVASLWPLCAASYSRCTAARHARLPSVLQRTTRRHGQPRSLSHRPLDNQAATSPPLFASLCSHHTQFLSRKTSTVLASSSVPQLCNPGRPPCCKCSHGELHRPSQLRLQQQLVVFLPDFLTPTTLLLQQPHAISSLLRSPSLTFGSWNGLIQLPLKRKYLKLVVSVAGCARLCSAVLVCTLPYSAVYSAVIGCTQLCSAIVGCSRM